MRLALGISDTTGVVYGIRLLEVLRGAPDVETHLVISRAARRAIAHETDYDLEGVDALATRTYDDRDLGATLASGSFRTAGMVIAPCGIETVAALANSDAASLITRAGDVTLQEGRPLVVVVRETPLHLGHLRQLLALAEMGGVILPPMPAFYPRPRTVDDIVNHTVGRVLDRFHIAHTLVREWTGTGRPQRPPEELERDRAPS
ncbi:MAG: UbiX family flavin prenyltransferase [Candidatus Rokubacteria bacterium]|nr:UbiX family flavin prenyltransferase [Candidatus Rokubacteria bacterium]